MEAASTYRAVQAVSQGRLDLTKKTLQAPGPGKVRIRVEACGFATREDDGRVGSDSHGTDHGLGARSWSADEVCTTSEEVRVPTGRYTMSCKAASF